MRKVLHALLLGIIGAGIVHIIILLMLPAYSERNTWVQLSAMAEPYTAIRLERNALAGTAAASSNPFLTTAACRFDLFRGALHMQAEGTVPFWSMSVYDQNGLNIFSINDRTAARSSLDFVVVSPSQMQHLQAGLPAAFAQSLFVETGSEEGVAMVRVFVPDHTWEGLADDFFESLRCRSTPLE